MADRCGACRPTTTGESDIRCRRQGVPERLKPSNAVYI
nr:MAG TPA: hypothetical protein [Caudoviricetes sp.]